MLGIESWSNTCVNDSPCSRAHEEMTSALHRQPARYPPTRSGQVHTITQVVQPKCQSGSWPSCLCLGRGPQTGNSPVPWPVDWCVKLIVRYPPSTCHLQSKPLPLRRARGTRGCRCLKLSCKPSTGEHVWWVAVAYHFVPIQEHSRPDVGEAGDYEYCLSSGSSSSQRTSKSATAVTNLSVESSQSNIL